MPIINKLIAKSSIAKTASLKGVISKKVFINTHPGQPQQWGSHPHPHPHPHPNPFYNPNPYGRPPPHPTLIHPNTHTFPHAKFSCKWDVHGSKGHGTGTITCKW